MRAQPFEDRTMLRPPTTQGDRLFIDVRAGEELDAWARHFRTSRERLVEVVARVGSCVAEVEQILEGPTYLYD